MREIVYNYRLPVCEKSGTFAAKLILLKQRDIMVRESEILGYVNLCQLAEKNESPKKKIRAYIKIKELMCKDYEKVLLGKSVSSDWVIWWWKAVESVHDHLAWREDIGFQVWKDDHFKTVFKMEEIPEWIGCMNVGNNTRRFLFEDIGPGSTFYKNLSTQKGFQWLNNFFPSELNDKKPEVTPLDVVFCEMLAMIDGRFSYNARLAVVAGEAESEEEAKPPSEYYGGIFFRTIASEIELMDKELTEEEIKMLQKHTLQNDDAISLALTETLTSQYDAKRLLAVYKNLTEKEYLYCTEEAWLYVWGVRVHPTKKTEIKAPVEIPRWSAMRGKKTAIGDMINTLMAKNCGKPWKKTAKSFVFSDGSQPVERYLKTYGLQGPSKTEFLKLVSVH